MKKLFIIQRNFIFDSKKLIELLKTDYNLYNEFRAKFFCSRLLVKCRKIVCNTGETFISLVWLLPSRFSGMKLYTSKINFFLPRCIIYFHGEKKLLNQQMSYAGIGTADFFCNIYRFFCWIHRLFVNSTDEPVKSTDFFSIGSLKMDLLAPEGEIKFTLWPVSRKIFSRCCIQFFCTWRSENEFIWKKYIF